MPRFPAFCTLFKEAKGKLLYEKLWKVQPLQEAVARAFLFPTTRVVKHINKSTDRKVKTARCDLANAVTDYVNLLIRMCAKEEVSFLKYL